MSYFSLPPSAYQVLPAGTPGWQLAPVPGWGVNPYRAGPKMLATEGVGRVLRRRGGMRKAPWTPYGCRNKTEYLRCERRHRKLMREQIARTGSSVMSLPDIRKRCEAMSCNYVAPPTTASPGFQSEEQYLQWRRKLPNLKRQAAGIPARWTIADWTPVVPMGATDSEEQGQQGAVALAAAGGIFAGWVFAWLYWSNAKKRK